MSSLVELEIQYQRLVAERNALGDRFEAGEQNLLPEIKQLNSRIRAVITEIENIKAVNSSGVIINDDQKARVSGAELINPGPGLLLLENGRVKLPPDTTAQTNALRIPDPVDFGTDDTLRPYLQTQSTPPGASQTSNGVTYRVSGYPTVNEDAFIGGNFTGTQFSGAQPGGQGGVGANSDDSGTNNIVSSLNSLQWADKITPTSNVLDQYASYTYQASLYLMDKKAYEQSIDAGKKNLTGAKLIVQTGGAPQGDNRSDSFDLDYYIDRIDLKSFFVGKAVRLAHNVKEVSMTIVEPNGISFLQNLNTAVQQYIGGANNATTYYENNGQSSTSGNKKLNFTSQIYLLVIRFYGYDQQGNLVRGGTSKPDLTSDPNAFVEKWYPLIISKVNFKIANKAVEYEIQAKAPPYYIGASSGRGTIPYNMEFSGETLKDVLAGGSASAANDARRNFAATDPRRVDLTPTTTSAPPKAAAASSAKLSARNGLITSLNNWQKKLKDDGVIEFADEYEIEFALDTMASATISNPGLNKSATPMSKPGTASDQMLGSKQSMDPKSRVLGATAGMQIVQFIDNAIRNSSYIRDQQTVIIEEKTGAEKTTGINIKNTVWYKIGFKATPMLDKHDSKRNDYAYKIKYIISPFKIAQLNSPYFKVPSYPGPHKQYRYWFTGQNTQVLSYEENLNALYYIVMTNSNLGGATSSDNEALKYFPGTASGQNDQNAEGRTNEPSASAADQLYSPSDLKECNMTIVGDPAWLQQGEALSALSKGDPYYYAPFLADGTINFDAQQILFEVGFNTPRDYDTLTGLIDPGWKDVNSVSQLDQLTETPGTTQISRIYLAKECVSSFNKGRFTQTLKGSLMIYYPATKAEERATITAQAANQGAKTQTSAPAYTPPRSSVTDPQPTSALAKGVQQILNPPTQLDNPTLSQLQSSPVYIQARRGGATPQAALAAAQAAYAAGTNNYSGTALPGIRYPGQQIVKDQ